MSGMSTVAGMLPMISVRCIVFYERAAFRGCLSVMVIVGCT
jgi:hypothetical protein